jgi:hypothetical protein
MGEIAMFTFVIRTAVGFCVRALLLLLMVLALG